MESKPTKKIRDSLQIIFLNVGRSGSGAVAKHWNGFHEPDGYFPDIEKTKIRMRDNPLFVETSHYWMWRLNELVKEFPKAIRIHLVRNGKDTVKSLQQRRHIYNYNLTFHRKSTFTAHELPIQGWNNFSRFEKLCWYWRWFNEKIEEVAQFRMRLEDLNIEKSNEGPKHDIWTQEEEEIFERVCSDLNRKYGY